MKFNSNNDLIPGNFFSKTKEKELENKIEALTQLVTFLSDKITQFESAIVTGTVIADSVIAQNVNTGTVTADSAEITTETVGTSNIANLNASNISTSTVKADAANVTDFEAKNIKSNSLNSNSFTGISQHLTGNSKVDGITDLNEVNANSITTKELKSGKTSLTGLTIARGNILFPEAGDKIYGEYLAVDAKNIKASSLTTKTPQDSSKLVGYDENGELIPVDATLEPSNLWKLKESDENYIEPKNEKKLAGDVVNVEYENEVNTLQNIIPKLGKTKTVNNFAPDNSGNILVSWCGTKNEYEEIKDTIPDGVIVHVIGE